MRCILFLLLCGVCCGCSRSYADEEAAVTVEVAKRIALFSTAAPPAPKPTKCHGIRALSVAGPVA